VSRPARAVFGALVVATVAAFFVTQHLKVTTPVLTGASAPRPGAINPRSAACGGQYRRTRFSFYLLHRADDVDVYVVSPAGEIIRTLASGRHMRRGVRHPDGEFSWDGREDNRSYAPDGSYDIRVVLIHQNRSLLLLRPIVVETHAPRPVVTRVTAGGALPAILPALGGATIAYQGAAGHRAQVLVYRTGGRGRPQPVASFASAHSPAVWDGLVGGAPAPAGNYLIGLSVTDRACNTGRVPASLPPVSGTTTGAGVTVRYHAAAPQLDPAPGGGTATVFVDARRRPYTWALRRVGARRSPVRHGSARSPLLRVPLPRGPGLYELALRSGSARAEVPVVAHGLARRPILVVLPALTWQGENPGDEDGDGLADTLDAGGPIELTRAFAAGLPAGVGDTAAMLAWLDHARLPYDLTTDLGLLDGIGPGLYGHTGVVIAGPERWLPASLSGPLRAYVQAGHRVVSIGSDSLRRSVSIVSTGHGAQAATPGQPAVADALGATAAPLVPAAQGVVLAIADGLGVFAGTSDAFPGFGAYQPITGTVPPAGKILSSAGPSSTSAAIAGFRLGHGIVVEIGAAGFGSIVARSVDSQELVRRLWTILAR
jgi:hypothetical protein